jgi:hypothetical protein
MDNEARSSSNKKNATGKLNLSQAAEIVNTATLSMAVCNPTGLVVDYKRKGLNKAVFNLGIDVMVVCETLFAVGCEPITLMEGYRSFYAGIDKVTTSKRRWSDTKGNGKWGVAVMIRDCLRVGMVHRGEGTLRGRVLMISVLTESLDKPTPIWIVCVYAPVREVEQTLFYEDLAVMWKECIHKDKLVAVLGDLNTRIKK